MEIRNQTETKAQLNIYGDIVSDQWGKWSDDDTCPSDISEFLKNLEGASEIEMHINSGGGSVFAGIAIYNMLKRSKATVTTYIDGIAASIASVIACAGDRVIIPKNGTFMIHKPTTSYFFESLDADELRKDADTLDHCQNSIVQTYMERVKDGVGEQEINDLVNQETWMNGSEAAEYFDFEVEEDINAAACASDFFGTYKNTPENVKKQEDSGISAEKIADMVIEKLQSRKQAEEHKKTEDMRKEILEDLDMYGI